MSFKLHSKGDRWELMFSDEPDYIHALQMAPESLEPELESGIWLIVAFPIWSGPVRDSVRAAVFCAKKYSGKFNLGVRPYDYHEEMMRWWPTDETPRGGEMTMALQGSSYRREVHITADSYTEPSWLVLKDGQVFHQGAGPRSAEQLSEIMSGLIR